MKDVFHSFYPLSGEEYAALWKDSLFVLDASFLCNLYRLPEKAQCELLVILSLLSDRLWVPHHAALEFQRNRLKVIADQKKKFTEVRKLVSETQRGFKADISKLQLKKRHSLIDPDPLLARFDALFDSFEEELSEFEAKQLEVSDPDPLLEKLDELLDSKIGSAPDSQEEMIRSTKRARRVMQERYHQAIWILLRGMTKKIVIMSMAALCMSVSMGIW
jgi:hypothetical protein